MASFGALFMLLAASLSTARPMSASSCNALYVMSNEQANSVIAIPVNRKGELSGGTVTPTKGMGGNSVDGATGKPAETDPLIGQSSVAVSGQHVFAVNAGSNTLSMLAIDHRDPTKLTLVGAPAEVQGEFPNSVAVSPKNNLVCVATTGAVNGVSCTTFSNQQGLGAFDDLRSFGLQQMTPPVGPTNSVSQLFFSEDERMLFATVKGDPAVNNTGFFSAFPVQNDCTLAAEDIRTSPDGTAVLFGSANIPGSSSVFATDASFGAAILSVDAAGSASLVAEKAIDGQVATCWATFSRKTGSAFVTDVARNLLIEMSVADASILGTTEVSGSAGMIDLTSSGNAVYAVSPGNGTLPASIMVMDVSRGQGSAALIQQFDLSSLGGGQKVQGIASLRK